MPVSELVVFEAVLGHDLFGEVRGFGKDVEECADAFAAEEDAAGVLVGFDGVFDARFGERGFEAQGLFEFAGDVDEIHFAIFEEVGVAAHAFQ